MSNQPKPVFTFGIEETLTALDGRNRHKLAPLFPYLSELTMDKFRVLVEIRYLQYLSKYKVVRKFTKTEYELLEKLASGFSSSDYRKIREIERTTNHEMKAVEKYIQLKIQQSSLNDIAEMVHFGLTTDDINNIVYALMLSKSVKDVLIPEIEKAQDLLKEKAKNYKKISMLGRTHGQPAAPTTLGKELFVYHKRLSAELKSLREIRLSAKLTGNTGNLNSHKLIYSEIDWLKFSKEFVESFGFNADFATIQIQPYDSYIRLFDNLRRINNIFLGLCVDLWIYISYNYFKQKAISKETGSTALPHKVNPIYLEGGEGGFGIANALFEFYSRKLSKTRMQRDLSDSTVRRSVNIALAYSLLSYQSMPEALKRIEPNLDVIAADLNDHWEVLSEAFQNFLRSKNYQNAYDKTKSFFRGKVITQENISRFISELMISKKDKDFLFTLTPDSYTGYAEEIVTKYVK